MKRFALGVLAALIAVACSSQDDDPGPPEWKPVLEHLDGTLLSVWGAAPDDVWTVGGPRGNAGIPPLVLHYDGAGWKRFPTLGDYTYWWVHGSGPNDVWMVGENGHTTHYDQGVFRDYTIPTAATLYGVWTAGPGDAWAVGGTPEKGTAAPNDLVYHWDGAAWTEVPLPQKLGRAFFKIWGTGSDNLYVVGEAGTIWHKSGSEWRLESDPPLALGTLLTVTGCGPNEVYAVGGRDVLRSDGQHWTRLDVQLTNDVNGVACGAPGEVVLVGFGGSKQRLVGGVWQDDFGTTPYTDLHGAWADGHGVFWAAGGDFVTTPAPGRSRDGVIARYGSGQVSTSVTGP